jgi:hypothetical protein
MRDTGQRDKLNEILKKAKGQGPLPWSHYRDAYCGRGKKSSKFAELMMEYAQRWPKRIIITRPYNVSESPMIEVLADG